jgi:hypothetical protein
MNYKIKAKQGLVKTKVITLSIFAKIKIGIIKFGEIIRRLVLKKKFQKVVKIIIIILVPFLAGMGVESLIINNLSNSNGVNVTPTVITTKEVITGSITSINLPQIEVKTIAGQTSTMQLVSKTILLSSKSKPITSSDIKVGNKVLIYVSKAASGELSVDRLRVTE